MGLDLGGGGKGREKFGTSEMVLKIKTNKLKNEKVSFIIFLVSSLLTTPNPQKLLLATSPPSVYCLILIC